MKFLVVFKADDFIIFQESYTLFQKFLMDTYIERSINDAVINFMLKNILSTIELIFHDPPYHGSLLYQGAPIIFWV